jgi:hypothetical protein
MKRLVALLLLCLQATLSFAQGADLRLNVETSPLLSPASAVAGPYSLQGNGNGDLFLVWLSATGGQETRSLLFSRFSSKAGAWTSPRVLVRALPTAQTGLQELLRLDVDASCLRLLWRVSSRSSVSLLCSADEGKTWEEPVPATPTDIRLSLLFPDGTMLVFYHNATPGEASDPRVQRRWEGVWQEPFPLGREGWKIANPDPSLLDAVAQAPWACAAWFTAADDEPRILLSSSPDAGQRWTSAVRADLGHARGSPSLLMLEDGSKFVSWLEEQGDDGSEPAGLYLRRYSASGWSISPALLVRETGKAPLSAPRLVLLRAGSDKSSAELAQAWIETSKGVQTLRLLRVRLPQPSVLAASDQECNCSLASLPGFGIKGSILSLDMEKSRLRISHGPVPGILKAGELEVQTDAAAMGSVREGRQFIGRIERRGNEWHLMDLRIFAQPK